MTDFILGFHCHQPLGNFDDVLRNATARAYLPILEELERHPGVKVVLHFSGCLLEWSEEMAPELFDRIGALVARGQAELLGGGFYEPILPVIPERDAIGQIEALRTYLRRRFDTRVRGIWLAERVWEPQLARTLAAAGVEYLPVDDTHFLGAGLVETDLDAAWRARDGDASVSLYPIRERLRYLIPFRPVQETLDWLRALGSRRRDGEAEPLAVMADDGEKFGVWPGTSEWVFGKGWLESFLSAVEENRSWLRTTTFSERHDRCPPRRAIHVPAASYFEMGEWALPVPAGRALREAIKALRGEGRFETLRSFLKGGDWRYFLTKYPESDHLMERVHALSDRMEEACVRDARSCENAVRSSDAGRAGAAARAGRDGLRAGDIVRVGAGSPGIARDSSKLEDPGAFTVPEGSSGDWLVGSPVRLPDDLLRPAPSAKLPEALELLEAAEITKAAGKPMRSAEAASESDRRARLLDEARRALWQAQCNCPYWHGVFGGIYLPFLRAFNESALVRARRLYEEAVHDDGPWIEAGAARGESGERNGGPALRVDTRHLGFTADPALGGALLDLEFKTHDLNVTSVLARREEIYHDELSQAAASSAGEGLATVEGTPSIHERPATGDRGPVERFVYDLRSRLAFVDHLYEGLPGVEDLATGRAKEIAVGWIEGSEDTHRGSRPDRSRAFGHRSEPSALTRGSRAPAELESTCVPAEFEVGGAPADFEVGRAPADFEVGGAPAELEVGRAPAEFEIGRAPGLLTLSLASGRGVCRRKSLEVKSDLASLTVTYEIASTPRFGAGDSRDRDAARNRSEGSGENESENENKSERENDATAAFYFGPEIPVALWEKHGRVLWEEPGGIERAESLSFPGEIDETARVMLTNDLTGLRIAIETSPPAPVRTFPLRTISRSESGYDEIYQGTIVQVLWKVPAPGEPPLRAFLTLKLSRN